MTEEKKYRAGYREREEGELEDEEEEEEEEAFRGNYKRKHSADERDLGDGDDGGRTDLTDFTDFAAVAKSEHEEEEPAFFVDVEPSKSKEKAAFVHYSVDRDLVSESSKNAEKSKRAGKGPQQSCWNCGVEGHSLRDCTAPRNAEAINRNRQAFMDNPKRMMYNEFKRYHLEVETNKYSDLTPGRLSGELREALGLSRRRLPRHIYLMRMLGYPPGWLLEAHVPISNIDMYDKHGNKVGDPDDEEGEITSLNKQVGLNLNSIVRYPGFNVNPSHKTEDEHYLYNAPPMNPNQNINVFISTLRESVRCSTMPPQPQLQPPQQRVVENAHEEPPEPEDMDIVELPDSDIVLAAEVSKSPPPPPPPPPPPLPTEELPPPPDSEPELDNESDPKNEIGGDVFPKTTTKSERFADLGKVKSVYIGTPVYSQHSPYTKLPTWDKFGKDMPEVVNFENLPKSTGMFRKMSKVLKKVRRVMTENQTEKQN